MFERRPSIASSARSRPSTSSCPPTTSGSRSGPRFRPLPILGSGRDPPGRGPNKKHGNRVLRRLVSPMRELERDLPADAAPTADALPITRLVVIGPGRAGRSIAAAAGGTGLPVRLAGRADALEACREADVALLCVPDDEIATACATVAPAVPPFVGHVSGASTLDALGQASDAGAQVFSLHPLQTIPDAEADLVGAPCAIAGSTPEGLALAR